MSFKIEISSSLSGAYVDVSDFITHISDIPYITRNDDYTIVSDYVKIKQSNTYTSYQFDIGNPVLIWSGSQLLYNGVISEKNILYDSYEYEYLIENSLLTSFNLKKYKVTSDDFEPSLTPYRQQKTIYGKAPVGYWINAYDVVNAIFDKVGVSLDTTYLQYHGEYVKGYEFIHTPNPSTLSHTESLMTIGTDTLYFWEPMIYGIGQQNIQQRGQIQNSPALMEQTISLFDLLGYLSSLLSLVFIPKAQTEYYIVSRGDVPTFSNNFEMFYEEKKIDKKYEGATLSYYHLNCYGTGLFTMDPNRAYAFFPFMPCLFQTYFWWVAASDGFAPYSRQYSTTYGEGEGKIDWVNHLIPFELLPYAGEGNILRMILPRIDTEFTIISNLFKYNLGDALEKTHKNLLDTNFYSTIINNYITIADSDTIPYSTIQTKEFTI